MTEVFVIRNQLGHYWGKSKAWVDGSLPRVVLRTKHRDEAVNTLVELSSKDFELRGEIVAAELSERREPMIEASQNPLELDEAADTEEPDAKVFQGDTSEPAISAPGDAEPAQPVS